MQNNELNENEKLEIKDSNFSTLNVELNDTLFKFIEIEEGNKPKGTLAGKPRILVLDVIRRFVKNYIALFALFVIIAISLSCLIIPAISPYSATSPISDKGNVWLSELPPSYDPIVTESLSKDNYNTLLEALGGEESEKWKKTVFNVIPDVNNDFIVTYNKYVFLEYYTGSKINSLVGTNALGVDIWTRTWTAARDSITLSFLVATTDAFVGITIGCVLGFYAGKWIDTVLSRIVDVIINIPTLIWFLMLMTIVGKSNINPFVLYGILISIGWVYMVNQSRLWMITVKDQEFILAAKAVGCSTPRQIFIHGLPMIIGKLSTNYVRRIVVVILSVSSLVFLGFLDSTNDPNLGTLLKEAIPLLDINFWALLLPSIILLFFSLSSQFVANGLHDALDPKVGRGK